LSERAGEEAEIRQKKTAAKRKLPNMIILLKKVKIPQGFGPLAANSLLHERNSLPLMAAFVDEGF